MRHQELSRSTQDCLKHLLDLGGQASPGDLAKALHITGATLTGKIKQLHEQGLVHHRAYQAISLTESGKQMARDIQRHHQLLTLYLYQVLGYSIEDAAKEAETLEHHISEKLEDRLFDLLGQPIQQRSSTP